MRGKAKDGTTRFYRVAKAYLVLNGLRVTLALHFVLPDDDTVEGVGPLLAGACTRKGWRWSCLLLDKGFESIAVLEYLTQHGRAGLDSLPDSGDDRGDPCSVPGPQKLRTIHTFEGAHGAVSSPRPC